MAVTNPRFQAATAAYLHIPFCRHRCGYCNFTVTAGRDELISAFLDAVETELSGLDHPRPVTTLYFGGGTPSHLPPVPLRRLCETARHWLVPQAEFEFTVEANPLDITVDRLAVLAEQGVTRISLGVQSFQEQKLAFLERDHRRRAIERALELVRETIGNVSLDLIYGVPGETLNDWRSDLQSAIVCDPDHVSIYGLTYERGARLYGRLLRGAFRRVDEPRELQMYETAIDHLTAAGFDHYEVSNFARPGRRCRHNEAYWTGRCYYAAGPGAARHIDGCRETNHRSLFTYLKRIQAGQSPVAERERLAPEDAARERLVFSLRMLEGLRKDVFVRETGFDADVLLGKSLQSFVGQGLLDNSPTHLRLTRAGLVVSDALWPLVLRG